MAFEPHLHWSFQDEHVLLHFLVLHSFWSFLAACILISSVCLLERFLTFLHDIRWVPHLLGSSPLCFAIWKTGLYTIATFLRLCYMLIAMTFHIGLIIVTVISLSLGQFLIELRKASRSPEFLSSSSSFGKMDSMEPSYRPLLSQDDEQIHPPVKTRPRSKSRPDDIFIHPAESNIARADAVAIEMGLGRDTDRVRIVSNHDSKSGWEFGKGKDLAKEILGPKKPQPPPQQASSDDS